MARRQIHLSARPISGDSRSYEVKEKKPSLINFDFANGLYTVSKELDTGYLAIGKQKVKFHRTEDGR